MEPTTNCEPLTAAERIDLLEETVQRLKEALDIVTREGAKDREIIERLASPARTGPQLLKLKRPPRGMDLVVFARRRCAKCEGTGKIRNDKWEHLWEGGYGEHLVENLNEFREKVGPGIIDCGDCEGFGWTAQEMTLQRALAHLRPEDVDAERSELTGEPWEE